VASTRSSGRPPTDKRATKPPALSATRRAAADSAALVGELLPHVCRFNPTIPDVQLLGLAESMAELRLLDEEIG
jgi:hypothetical protein